MKEILGYASGVLVMLSAIPYIKDIFLLKTKPERATWLIWSVLLAIAFFAQIYKGGTWELVLMGTDLAAAVTIFILSFKYGVGGATKFDIFALVGALVSLVLWYFTNDALVALLAIIVIDFLGGFLTIVKTYKDPSSETFSAYMICAFGAFLGVLSVGQMNFSLLIFPIWICLLNFSIGITILLGKRRLAI